jgi:hypothetical protein
MELDFALFASSIALKGPWYMIRRIEMRLIMNSKVC